MGYTVYSTGNVNCNVTTGVVTRQSGAIAWTGVAVGDVITIADDGAGVGEGVILSIDDTGPGAGAQITITTENLPDTDFTNVGYEIRQKPKYTIHDSNYASVKLVMLVSMLLLTLVGLELLVTPITTETLELRQKY